MRIRTKLLFLLAFTILFFAIGTTCLYLTEKQIAASLTHSRNATAILKEVTALHVLGVEFTPDNVERVAYQWVKKRECLEALIRSYKERQNTPLLARLERELDRADSAFMKLKKITQQNESNPNKYKTTRQYMLSHLTVLLDFMSTQANMAARDGFQKAYATQQVRNWVLAGIVTCAIVFMALWALALWKSLMRPLGELSQAIDSAASGNLSARVGQLGKGNEIVDVSQAFNAMTRRLEKITVSRQRFLEATDNERGRIGRELHDGIGQALTAGRVLLGNEVTQLEKRGCRTDGIQKVRELLGRSLEDLRRTIHNLRPAVLDELGLKSALQWLCRTTEEVHSVKVLYDMSIPEDTVPPMLRSNLYRIIQEALNNSVRHGKPSRIDIQIGMIDNELDLMIEDDGMGFDADTVSRYGNGLSSIRERAAAFGGEAIIESAPGRGVCITVTVPLCLVAPPSDED
ncbi:ATP-binding protein [Pseudodesulfovibrio tunisiensis]|uniref:sensor histidine kinase n=1 Tax=Pseudodesulfovibrio tunisiensis TaxID=463192 RepID=UPI001FB286C1|nr:ATP-binding protein [Pseudodesulfovibrio tunisiensis]